MQLFKAYFGKFFVESWMYSAALNIVDQCAEWFSATGMDSTTFARFNGIKGELLELARSQVKQISTLSDLY